MADQTTINKEVKVENKETLQVREFSIDGFRDQECMVTRELPLAICLNGQALVTLLCSPADPLFLAIGMLFSEGIIKGKEDIKDIRIKEEKEKIEVEVEVKNATRIGARFKPLIASGGAKRGSSCNLATAINIPCMESPVKVSASSIFNMVSEFLVRSETYLTTTGVHSAALCDSQKILVFNDDIGRHNAIDKVLGQCLWEGIPLKDRLMITSGRISSEILLKVAKGGIPIIISKAAPTDLGVRLAKDFRMTLVGMVRNCRMNVYSHSSRVVLDQFETENRTAL